MNDVVAVTAFIGSIFGAGGGGEAANSDLLAKLQQQLGADQGYKAWSDVMLADDPEAPTTITRRFEYGPLHRRPGDRLASCSMPASIQSIDPRQPAALAAAAPARRRASNFLVDRAVALGVGQHARRDGAAARLLLPGDRAADRTCRAPASRRRASPCPACRCTS